jgi:aryl carrier-like protein
MSGEIYIGGAGVARGYLKRPQLTAERFVKDPFQADPQARMYRTGDVGRWRVDGTIEYLGRNDSQVKIRGYRIELGEIEAQMLKCEGVGEAVVLAQDGVSGEKRLVAYYTVKREEPTIERLRSQLESKLPQYMVPSAYVRLESMPLTPNGKLDRRALPVPAGEASGQRGYEVPQGELESTLAQLWQEVLQVERVGRRDNFFELGGHSLLAVTLIERMRQRGLAADVRSLFTAGTLTEFARHLNNHDARNEVPDNPLRELHKKIDSVSTDDLIELTV